MAEQLPTEFAGVQSALDVITVRATGLVITTPAEYTDAAELLRQIKTSLNQIEEQRVSITKPLNEALKVRNAEAKAAAEPFLEAERKIKAALVDWKAAEDRRLAEAQRIANEAAAKERAKLEERAAKAEASGNVEKAAALTAVAQATVAPTVAAETAKVSGITTRKVWQFRVDNPLLVPPEYRLIDEKKIGKVVRAMGGDTKIPGVTVWAEDQIAARSA